MSEEFDVIVIGGGPAGENAGDRAGRDGLSVALVERELVGGECSYWACMPSKALLRPGEVLAAARRTPGAREAVTGELDVAAALARRDVQAAQWDDRGQVEWVASTGMTLVRGHGRLAGERTVEVETSDGGRRELTARKAVVVAVGSTPSIPPVEGLAEIRTWDNRQATEATTVPRRLLVLGGGVVGVELAQAFAWLGAEEVTVVEMADRLLAAEEPFAGEELRASFEGMGIAVRTSVAVEAVSREGHDGPVTARLGDGSAVVADELLVATGRRPATQDLGLETVGLDPTRPIAVDDHLVATDVAGGWLYVVGDANGRAPLTHQGKYQARIAGDHIAGRPIPLGVGAVADHHAVPRVVFTDPQIAAVGLTEARAREQGHDVRTVRYGTGDVAGASSLGEGISGTSQLVIDQATRTLLGATFVGPGVGEMLHAATIAVAGRVTLDQLWHAVPAYPTVSEVWLRLLEADGM